MPSPKSLLSRLPLLKNWFTEPTAQTSPIRTPTIISAKTPTLVGRDLLRTFGSGDTKTYALREASIELHRGNLNLLMGPSGSGKSTLLAVISALLRPESGSVIAADHDIWNLNDRQMEQFRLTHCSYIFQGYNLFPAYTARQQLEVVLEWGEGVSRREARKRADHVLGQLGLTSRADLRPAALSGGEKQRVAIARALVKNPTFIFADEPTSALDWDNGQQVMNLLKECAKVRNATVLVVTHDHRLEGYADNIFKMADGRMLPNKTPVKRSPESLKLMGNKERLRLSNLELAHV